MRYDHVVRSGLARSVRCAVLALVASCDPLSYGQRQQLAIGDGGATVDDAFMAFDDLPPPVDSPTEAGPDATIDAPPPILPDAMSDGMPDAMPDAMVDAGIDAAPTDGGPGDGSLTDALGPDARDPPGLPVGGSTDDTIQSFYACSTGDGASAVPLLLAISILALRRRRR